MACENAIVAVIVFMAVTSIIYNVESLKMLSILLFVSTTNETESMTTMKRIKTVSLIGLGAIGSANLAKIAETVKTEDLCVIASATRAERYRNNGVNVCGVNYYFRVVEPEKDVTPPDLLIFAVKNNHLEQAIKDIRKHVGQHTVILSLLNGVTSENEIGKIYGMDKVLYSYVMGTDATRINDSTVYNNIGHIVFGESLNVPGSYSEHVSVVEEFFERTGILYKIPENMIKALWTKFMLNVGANQVSAILRCPYGAIQKVDSVRNLVISAMEEAASVSRAENIMLDKNDITNCLAILDKLSSVGKTSMLQDVEAARKTEVDVFGGAVSSLGKKHNIAVPVNDMMVRIIKAMEDTFSL